MTTRENLKEKFNYTKDKIKKLAVVPNSIKNFYDFIYNHPKYSSLLFFTFIYLIVYILFLFNPSKFLNDYFYKKYNDYTNFSNIIITLALFSLLMVIMFKTYNIILNERNFSEQFKKSLQYLSIIFITFLIVISTSYALVNYHFIALVTILILNLLVITIVLKYVLKDLLADSIFKPLIEKLLFIPNKILEIIGATKKSVFYFVAIEIFIILSYFIYPFLREKAITRKGKLLLKKPVYTNYKKTLSSFFELNDDAETYNYHYTLSSWFFIHERPPNTNPNYTKYTELLNYGNKPKILYNAEKQKIKVTMKQGQKGNKTIYIGEFPLQKWNNIVISYDRGTLDVFINAKLVATEKNVVPYMEYDNLEVGAIRGIDGGVANVVYYPNILPLETIIKKYNILKKNPIL